MGKLSSIKNKNLVVQIFLVLAKLFRVSSEDSF